MPTYFGVKPVAVTKDRVNEVLKSVQDMMRRQLLVGIPAEDPSRQPEPSEPDPPTNAVIGYTMEFGDPDRRIPPRPHLLPGMESVLDPAVVRLRKAGMAALTGDKEAVDKAFIAVGLLAQNAVRAKITDGPFVKLSPRTLAERRARGRAGEKPLIDTGQLRRAYTYVVRVRGQ